LLRYDLFAKYLGPQTYTIIHQCRSRELAAILRGKLISGSMKKYDVNRHIQYDVHKKTKTAMTGSLKFLWTRPTTASIDPMQQVWWVTWTPYQPVYLHIF